MSTLPENNNSKIDTPTTNENSYSSVDLTSSLAPKTYTEEEVKQKIMQTNKITITDKAFIIMMLLFLIFVSPTIMVAFSFPTSAQDLYLYGVISIFIGLVTVPVFAFIVFNVLLCLIAICKYIPCLKKYADTQIVEPDNDNKKSVHMYSYSYSDSV
jgi:hypothetical protein